MSFLEYLLLALFFVVGCAGIYAVVLSFTKRRHTPITLVCALPALVVGTFYIVAFMMTHQRFSPAFLICWLLMFFGGLATMRWFSGRGA